MKLKKISTTDGNNDLASDLNNLKNEDNAKVNNDVNNADKCKLDDCELKLATNVLDNSKHEPKHATNGANTSEHNSDMVSNDSDAKTNGEDVVNYDTTVTKHLNSNSSTVTLLGQSVERLQSDINHETNSYKDNDDLDDSNPDSLLVESTVERRNGSDYGSSYLHQFKDDKDCSSSSSSSSIHGTGELEDDSAQMVLRLSEDESGTFATSPIPTASVDMLLNQPDQVQGDLCKMSDAHLLETDQEKTNNLSPVPSDSNTVENTNSYSKLDKMKTVIISTYDIYPELATDKCSVHSDDHFDDLLCNMSPKEIELTKKNNDGVTVSDLRKEIEDFLKTESSISSEGSDEKPVRNTEVSTENVAKSVNNTNSSLTSKNDETANTTNSDDISKNVLQTPDTEVTNEDNDDAKKNDEELSDIESASGSTIVISSDMENASGSTIALSDIENASGSAIVISSVGSDTDPTRNDEVDDDDDDDYLVEIDSTKDNEFSSGEIISELITDDDASKPDEVHPSDKQDDNDEQDTSEIDESDESIKILTISDICGSIGLDTTATDDCGIKAKETLVDNDKNEVVEETGDKVNSCAVVSDNQIDDVEENTEGSKSRSSLKRSLENSDDDIEQKKLKTDQPTKKDECTPENTEQPIKTDESKPEKSEQLTEVDKTNTTSVTDQTGKRTLEKEENDSKRLKLDNTSSVTNLEFFHKFMMRKSIRRLSRRDLEEFAVQKICESFNQHSKVAELLREMRIKDKAFETLRAKYATLHKQVTDLDIVQTRISNEMRKAKDPREVVPVKITRSVGLQVSLQPLKTKVNLPALVPHVSDPLVPITVTGPGKKKPQRAAATNNRVSMLPPPPPALTPAPTHVRPPPVPSGKGIKTILPKISHNGQNRDESNSLLGNMLHKSPISNNNASTATRRPAGDNVKVIDLTDEDDSNRASTSTSTQSGNIRVVAPHQLTNSSSETVSPLVTTNIPRLTYLVQSPGQQGQSVLLATTNAPTRPGQARPTLMFKPVVPQGGQKLNLVRPAVSGSTVVLPSSLSSSGVCKYVTTTYAPGPLTRSPALSTRAIAPASRHPAPLPGPPAVQASQPSWKLLPPKPALKIALVGDGIVLSWRILNKDMSLYEEIASYQLYAYQETSAPPTTEMWRKVGDVKALALPMACTLTQFTDGNKYHFAVRGVDVKTRVGPFSTPEQIILPAQ